MAGTLFICATPIGNLQDITLRVLEVLKDVDVIAAEDTRTTAKLLNHYGIKTPCISYHRHNEKARSEFLIARLLEGENVALVSDAGTPGISDPGSIVIAAAIEAGINVVSLPGPTACIAALVASGLPSDRFVFEGFLPRNRKQRRERLEDLASDPRTLVFYEAPHRLQESLEDFLSVLGDRRMVIIRELTKKFEEIVRGNISELTAQTTHHEARGEYVLVVEGYTGLPIGEDKNDWKYLSVQEHMEKLMDQGYSKKDAVKVVAQMRGLPRREVYSYVEELFN